MVPICFTSHYATGMTKFKHQKDKVDLIGPKHYTRPASFFSHNKGISPSQRPFADFGGVELGGCEQVTYHRQRRNHVIL